MTDGYLKLPAGEGPWPGVVVIQDILGVNDVLRGICDYVASQGYAVFAPDLYQGGNPRCVQQVFVALRTHRGPVFSRMKEARDMLAARPDCTGQVGVIGFCMGGEFAIVAAGRRYFDAAAVNYGRIPKDVEWLLVDPCPIVASFGKNDPAIRPAAVKRLRDALADVPHDIKAYDNASHSFMQNYQGIVSTITKITGLTHNPEATNDAWRRIFAFFNTHLKP